MKPCGGTVYNGKEVSMKYLNFEQFKSGNILGTGESNKVFDQYFTDNPFKSADTERGFCIISFLPM